MLQKHSKTTCPFFGRNNLCHHALTISKNKNELLGLLKQYPGRNLNAMATTNTAPKGVTAKAPPKKKTLNIAETPHMSAEDVSHCLLAKKVDQTKIVIPRNNRPADPPITSPLIVKKIAGGIRKSAGRSKEIKGTVVGYNQDEDSQNCLAWHEAYYFWS